MVMTMTKHVSIERANRIEYINKTTGFGNEIAAEAILPNYQNVMRRMQLTNTGVIIVKPLKGNVVITTWIASIKQAIRITKNGGYSRMPDALYRTILNNQIYVEHQP